MHTSNEYELQRLRREELMREAERGRLVRRLRAERASGVRSKWSTHAWSRVRAAFGKEAAVGDCEG